MSTVKNSKSSSRSSNDTFLADSVRESKGLIGYRDGFRFGVGFMLAHLTLGLLVGGLAWAIVTAFNIK
jgi:hypothetical protein